MTLVSRATFQSHKKLVKCFVCFPDCFSCLAVAVRSRPLPRRPTNTTNAPSTRMSTSTRTVPLCRAPPLPVIRYVAGVGSNPDHGKSFSGMGSWGVRVWVVFSVLIYLLLLLRLLKSQTFFRRPRAFSTPQATCCLCIMFLPVIDSFPVMTNYPHVGIFLPFHVLCPTVFVSCLRKRRVVESTHAFTFIQDLTIGRKGSFDVDAPENPNKQTHKLTNKQTTNTSHVVYHLRRLYYSH